MKKIFILLLFFLICSSLHAEAEFGKSKEDDEGFSYYLTVDQLINKSLFKNKDLIFDYSQRLNSEQILLLQKKHQKDLVIPLLLNGFVGFGSGNFACGDMLGGGIHAGLDGLAVFSALTMQFINIINLFSPINSGTDSQTALENLDRRLKTFSYVMYSAISLMLVNRIASLFTASLYVRKYNRTLSDVLVKKTSKLSFNPLPIISPEGVGFGVRIGF